MKILYLITKSEIGGAQMHVAQLAAGMTRAGHHVAIMSFPGGWLEHQARSLGVEFFPNPYFANSFNPFRAWRAMGTIRRIVHDFSPDLVACHSSAAGILSRLAIRGNVPTVFTAHSWAFTTGAPFMRKIVAIIAEKIASIFTQKIICVSQFDQILAQKYRIAPDKKLTVIYNAAPSSIKKQTLNNGLVKILFLGRLAYPKKIDLLINAYAALPKTLQKSAQLTIIGDGPDRTALEHKVRTLQLPIPISFLQTTHEAAMQEMRRSDIFILLSKHEGFPMTILEAMAAGLPVIASKVGGIPEMIDAACGMLVENKTKVVTEALVRLIEDATLRKHMGDAAQARAAEHFSETEFFDKTLAVYIAVLRS